LVKLPRKVAKENVYAWIKVFWDLKGSHEVNLEHVEINKLIRSLGIKLVVLLFYRFRTFPMVNCMLLSHRSQALQTSRFSAAKVPMDTCRMWYIEVLEM
jgi:hypothetical protein